MGVKPIQRWITDQVLDNTYVGSVQGFSGRLSKIGRVELGVGGGRWWEMEDSVRRREFGDCGCLDDWRYSGLTICCREVQGQRHGNRAILEIIILPMPPRALEKICQPCSSRCAPTNSERDLAPNVQRVSQGADESLLARRLAKAKCRTIIIIIKHNQASFSSGIGTSYTELYWTYQGETVLLGATQQW